MVGNSDDKNNWREKYLDALDAQDKLEKQFAEQQELLRRALVRVSVAADGQDEALDSIMGQLREKLRGGINGGDIGQLLAHLEQAALAFEDHRNQGAQDIRQALGDTLKPFDQFKLSRSIKKEIHQFLSQLPQRSKKVRLYPALLQQLASIQQQALQEIEQPQTSLLGKLLSGKNSAQKNNVKDDDENPDDNNEKSIENLSTGSSDAQLQHHNTSPIEQKTTSPIVYAPQNSPTLAISTQHLSGEFSSKITRVLTEFLISLENEVVIKAKVEAIRRQIEKGLSTQALISALETVRDLVMEAYLAANQAFATYLNNVNQELAEIYSLLGGAVQNSADEREASRQLQANMMREMQNLEMNAANATDLNQLKNQVKSQLGNIRQAIDQYQHTDQARHQLAEQLETLGEKIKTMEVEAEKNRTSLEKHRHKALHDPLTELPNREAYNERAKAELQRWQRYGRPLTIAIFDIDHFKKINDTYGHQAGDRVLKVIARSIAKRLREVDFFCRYGGEEFVALLPETNGEAALTVLDKIRNAIANAAFNYKEQPLEITVSIGIATFKENDTLTDAFERADQALYNAKASGRNCARLEQ